MFLGYNTNGFAHHRLADTIDILAELGYRGLGLTADFHTIDPFARGWRDQAERLRRRLRQAGLRAVVETGARFILDIRRKHQPTLLDPDRHKSLARLEFLEACVDLAAALDTDVVSFWSGAPVDDAPLTILMARLAEGCTRLCDYAFARGVRLAFEPEPGMFVDTMDKFADLAARVDHPAFGLTIDVGHLQCNGELPIGDHVRRWKDRLWNVHIEDMRRGAHDHLMFGDGEIDFSEVMAALREIDYRGGAYVELSRHSHDAVETARRSIEFLRRFDPPPVIPPIPKERAGGVTGHPPADAGGSPKTGFATDNGEPPA
jgi:L-ribulose-5-phosphate 3-epimerase